MSQYYKKYMKKREEERPSDFKLFIAAFLLMMVFFIIVATHLTSSVDISIGENDEGDIKESGLGVKHLIDSRLRFIQMDDISGGTSTQKEKHDIEQDSSKTIKIEQQSGYSGQLNNSYGYDSTQETKPYSQTYTNTQKQVTSAPAKTTQTTGVQHTISVPSAQPKSSTSSAPRPQSSPAHSIQKNLTPTGMN